MKKLAFTLTLAAAAAVAYADDEVATAEKGEAKESSILDRVWGFGNYGIYSGYQLYGSLVNSEPTLQGYAEGNFTLATEELPLLGSAGIGVWSNTDLTDKRRYSYGKAFNEWDFNVHWDTTAWFDDDHTWGLAYRTEVVWYYYPHRRHDHMGRSTATTMDWNHYFELKNPFITPYFKWVHEYHENKANLWLGGFKKTIELTDQLSVTPVAEMVYRSKRYNWCFPTAGFSEYHGSGIASFKAGLESNYMITSNFGLFAKVYWCHTWDHSLRHASDHSSGADYGKYKDFAWGGVGVTFNF